MEQPIIITFNIRIEVFKNGWCPAMNLIFGTALRASKEFEGKIEINEFETIDRETFNEQGIMDALFIDGKEVRTGPPPPYEKIRRKIEKRVKKLQK